MPFRPHPRTTTALTLRSDPFARPPPSPKVENQLAQMPAQLAGDATQELHRLCVQLSLRLRDTIEGRGSGGFWRALNSVNEGFATDILNSRPFFKITDSGCGRRSASSACSGVGASRGEVGAAGGCMAPVSLSVVTQSRYPPFLGATSDDECRDSNVKEPDFWLDQQPDGATGELGAGRTTSRSRAWA